MNITIVGAGHGGTTVAADLKSKGHHITLLKTSEKLHLDHYEYLLRHNGNVTIQHDEKTSDVVQLDLLTRDYSIAFNKADLVILYVQTNFHEDVIQKMAPYLHNGQMILCEPGYLSTAYFIKHTSDKRLTVIEAESSPIDCRIESPGHVRVLFKNVRNPIGVYPKARSDEILRDLAPLGYRFTRLGSVIEAAIHNPNLIVHTVGAVMSIPRIEYSKGEYWMYREVFTPHVWNIVKSLDGEKMEVLEKLGFERLPYVEACKFRNAEDLSRDGTEVFFDYAQNSSPKGPTTPDTRYVTEDVPEGLVLLESLGKVLGVPTPTCAGLINIASAALSRDFRREGRSVERLGYDRLQKIIDDR